MNRDIKFVITKDLKYFKSETADHYIIAKENGYDIKDILESGLIAGGKFYVLECQEPKHREKLLHSDKYIANDVNKYLEELTNHRILKAREVETALKYKVAGRLGEGD
jgi:hypothetical protein